MVKIFSKSGPPQFVCNSGLYFLFSETIIAGNTTDYVNEVIAKVEEGDPTGGLPIKPRVKK